MNSLLNCTNLTKRYGGLTALSDVNLTLEGGRIIGLLGPNASGKTTLIKIINGLLVPDHGSVTINGFAPGIESKRIVSYLPDKQYLSDWMKVDQLFDYYADFYDNFDKTKAYEMLKRLNIAQTTKLKSMSKGTKEKVQLILVMSRKADLYCLDEPIGGVDPASRDYILDTIIGNYSENASILISTHLIADIENVLDEVVFLQDGIIRLHSTVDEIRAKENKSVDALFREVFKC